MILIVRREVDKIKRYVHLGTGNYHAMNAKIYNWLWTTTRVDICEDVQQSLQSSQVWGKMVKLKELFHATIYSASSIDWTSLKMKLKIAKAGKKKRRLLIKSTP
jgi:polyphosphate kinase